MELPVLGPDWTSLLLRGAAVAVGFLLLWAAIMAAVGVMLVPRPTNVKLALWVTRACHLLFRAIAHRARSYAQLDRYLAVQGPTTVLVYLALFLVIFVGAFGFLFYGVTGCSPSEAFYRSGSSMSTLGIMDASSFGALTVMFIAGFTGTTVISVLIGFLLTLYSAYTARETYMSKVSMVCGEPGWGPEMVARVHKLRGPLPDDEANKCVDWICAMRVSQYIYPLLNHFRSSVSNRHWVVTLLSILDAMAIRVAAIDGKLAADAARILAQGAVAFQALKKSEVSRTNGADSDEAEATWVIEEEMLRARPGTTVPEAGISRTQWDEAMEFLVASGVVLQADREAAWQIFCRIRSYYFEPAYFLANHLSAVNAPWSGPRHPAFDFPPAWPWLARKVFASKN